jgi:hypothetical protein
MVRKSGVEPSATGRRSSDADWPATCGSACTDPAFLEISWENFERLCLKVASTIDGLEDPRLFGERGRITRRNRLLGTDRPGAAGCHARRLEAEPKGGLLKSLPGLPKEGQELGSKSFTLCTARSAAPTSLQRALGRRRPTLAPSFIVPTQKVRVLSRVVRLAGIEPATYGSANHRSVR